MLKFRRGVVGLFVSAMCAAGPALAQEAEPAKPQTPPDAADGAIVPEADPAVMAEVNVTMRAMEAAMVAADTKAFLDLVIQTDSEFLHEQTYFAKDLAKKKPETVALTLEQPVVGDGAVEGKLTWAWTMAAEGSKPRKVSFRAKFVQVSDQWRYAGETWERHEAPGVIVYHDPGLGELAERTVTAFTAVRAKVEEGFELTDAALPKRTQKIKMYGSMRHLQQSICLSYTDGLGGWNEPNESIKLLANKSTTVDALKSLLAHEYGHVATFELGPKSNEMPWWVLEGVAELSAEVVANGGSPDRTVLRWAKTDKLVDFPLLADFDNCKPEHMGHVYTQGHGMMNYISQRWGRSGRNAWMRAMSSGRSIDDASRQVFQMDFAQLDREWRESLEKENARRDAEKAAKDSANGEAGDAPKDESGKDRPKPSDSGAAGAPPTPKQD